MERRHVSESARTTLHGFPRRAGSHGNLAPSSMLYPSSNTGMRDRTVNTSWNFDNLDNPALMSGHYSYSRNRSSTPPPSWETISRPLPGYEASHSMSRRSRESLSPRRTGGANSMSRRSRESLSPRRTGVASFSDNLNIARDPIDTHFARSATLPRQGNYGNTVSRYYDSSVLPTTYNTLSSSHRNLTPTRGHNRAVVSAYSHNLDSPINGVTNITSNYRRNRSMPFRSSLPNVRNTRGSPNVGHSLHWTLPGPVSSDTNIHFPYISYDHGIREPVNYYTYSDDEKEDIDRLPYYSPSNSESTDIMVKQIDCHVTENARDHHTERFAKTGDNVLIVRRAQAFRMDVFLSTRFSKSDHEISLEFTTGPVPQPGKGTYIKLSSTSPIINSEAWCMKTESVIDNKVTLSIETAPTAIVGKWKMAASVTQKEKHEGNKPMKKEVSFYMLFNPWSRDDDVYFPDKSKLSEYILNDSGCIFTGGHDQITAKPWFYGQFESGVLEAAFHCIKKVFDKRPRRSTGDPVTLSRAISKIVNSNDDSGVVWGNWSGNYRDGTAPLAWVGSVSILRQFMKTGRPVKYGQCFVFAGVVTTICRAIGIPCRTVTNFSSAHDTDGSVTVDVHWDTTTNNELASVNTDSIWNFHVWNDVWMKRKDLPAGNDGWQVLDSTPQETSDGEFRCGPAPLIAILNGKCDVTYDTAFIYAEVNADRVHWGRTDDGSWHVIGTDKSIVGKKISTKKPDGRPLADILGDCEKYRDDVTHQYKYVEGSERERMSVISATSSAPGGYSRIYTKDNDIKIKVVTPKSILIGSDIEITVEISNSAGVSKSLTGKMMCEVTKYTGAAVSICKEEAFDLEIEAYQHQKVFLRLSVDDYVDSISEAAMFRFALMTRVKETGQQFASVETFRLRLPDLSIKVQNKFLKAGVPVDVTIGFTNPLQTRSLTNCIILAECPGMKDMKVFTTRNVLPGEQFQTSVQVTPLIRGSCPLFMTFNCDQIHDVKGTCTMFVQ